MVTESILKIDAGSAVTTLADLKQNVSELKETLSGLTIGSEEYQHVLGELHTSQNALKDAMHASTASMEEIAGAATGATESYNGLVHKMAELKEQLRATDVSTEEGKAKFKDLADEINGVNDRLKEMDAMQGNYQRNVGNYKSALDGLDTTISAFSDSVDTIIPGAKGAAEGVRKLVTSMKAMKAAASSNPVGAALTVILTLITTIAANWDTIKGIIGGSNNELDEQKEKLKYAHDYSARYAESLERAKKAIKDSNSELEYQLSLRKAEGEDEISVQQKRTEAAQRDAKYWKDRVSSINAELVIGKELGLFNTRERRKKQKALEESLETAKKELETAEEEALTEERKLNILKQQKETADEKAAAAQREKDEATAAAQREKEQAAYMAGIAKSIEKAFAAMENATGDLFPGIDEDLDVTTEAFAELDRQLEESSANEIHAMAEMARARDELIKSGPSAVASILGSVADALEASGEESEEAFEAAKKLRIAEATINTISGVVSAFMGVTASTGGWGVALAAIQAAAVAAAGYAQIEKIKATTYDNASSSASSLGITAGTSAPTSVSTVQEVHNLSTDADIARLNEVSQSQKVYILQSDIEAADNARKAQVSESSF